MEIQLSDLLKMLKDSEEAPKPETIWMSTETLKEIPASDQETQDFVRRFSAIDVYTDDTLPKWYFETGTQREIRLAEGKAALMAEIMKDSAATLKVSGENYSFAAWMTITQP